MLFTFLLAPYLVIAGVPVNGGLIGVALVVLGAPVALIKSLSQRYLYVYGSFYLAASLFSAFVASWYGTPDLVIVKLFVSVVVYIVVGSTVGYYLARRDISLEDAFAAVLRIVLGIILLNAIVVVVEFYNPMAKGFVESFLLQGGAIDYKNHFFRLRGLASAGGAGLSVFHALGLWLALKLYSDRRISVLTLIACCAIIPFSVLFIGRTAVIVMLVAVAFFVLDNLSVKRIWLVPAVGLVIAALLYGFAQNIDYFIPEEVQEYSVLLFTQGVSGLEEEGTVGTVRSFLMLPESPSHLLFGIGYFGGANILNVGSDSGYIKFLLAFGVPLAIAVYAAFLLYLTPVIRNPLTRSVVVPMVIMLFLVEVKEPFVYQGYSARFMFIVGGIGMAYRNIRPGPVRNRGTQ